MIKRIKKILTASVALAISLFTVLAAGCGTYTPPSGDVGTNPPVVNPPVNPDPPENPDDPVPADGFKVSLEWQDVETSYPFNSSLYSKITEIQVQWTDIETKQIYRAHFNKEGVASRSDLDGDYTVTLVSIPDGYTYEPNSYAANNDVKEVVISLYKITPTVVAGYYREVPYINIDAVGTYRVTLQSESDVKLFAIKPPGQGLYIVQSMVDVTANEINPILDKHNGSPPYFMVDKASLTQDGGGAENTYTKNFKLEYTISADEVGNGLWFKLYSTCRNSNAYPLSVDFILKRDGDFSNNYNSAPVVPVTEDFSKTPETPAGIFTYCARRPGVSNKRLDMRSVKKNPADGYWYYYDSITDTYTDRLYAKISAANEVVGADQKLPLTDSRLAPYNWNGYNYVKFLSTYASHCNYDGCYPVNDEIKKMLMDFSVKEKLFRDGMGWAEQEAGYNSDENSQWMFACGYYAS